MTAESDAPLAGYRILEVSHFLAGPYCGLLLGDLGAEGINSIGLRGSCSLDTTSRRLMGLSTTHILTQPMTVHLRVWQKSTSQDQMMEVNHLGHPDGLQFSKNHSSTLEPLPLGHGRVPSREEQ